MHQICVASAHCRGKMGFFQEAFHVMTLLFLVMRKENRRCLLGRPHLGPGLRASLVCVRKPRTSPPVQHRSLRCERYSGERWGPERWPSLLGGYFLSFAFSGLVTGRRGLPFDKLWWQAKKLGEPVPDTLPWHGLMLGSSSQEGGGFRVVTLYVRAHSWRPCLIQILHNSRLIFL